MVKMRRFYILNNASGVIREKVDDIYAEILATKNAKRSAPSLYQK
ncbi:MAG: hypothetical protein ACLVKR_05015 [Lachnospiraceae bacterium]